MRDLVFTALVLIGAVFVFTRAWWGILLLAWLSYMNAQRLCFGFAVTFPFFSIVLGCTVIALCISKQRKKIPLTTPVWCLIALVIWMNVCCLFALNPDGALWEWNRTIKNMVVMFLTLMVMRDKRRLDLLAWCIVLSLGFYGVKGGIFTIVHGGTNTVNGPDNTFISDNNQLAVALGMALPLMRYLQLQAQRRWIRFVLGGMMLLTSLAVLGTYSRAGFISLGVVGLVMWMNSRRKVLLAVVIPAAAMILLTFMPAKWTDRMHTIKSYDEDKSTLGRFNAWHFAYNLANDRPLTGGGFDTFTPELFLEYAPEPDNFHAAHSIYFQMLGDNGYPGLFLFTSLLVSAWWGAARARRRTRGHLELAWAADLSGMLQASITVYMVGGATLSLAYFDLPYQLITMIVICGEIVRQRKNEAEADLESDSPDILSAIVDERPTLYSTHPPLALKAYL